ncbi:MULTISPECIES: sulfatase-like hydrolase/transferase [unclassified Nocardioides]|uniref:sulfatase-like hydrolase/transferase n=1 Tax=unclassified Nocardioides TaxID=2615069 RepID=UPI000AD6BC5B|nr:MULTISPECIES: sulfatase-like hydrolase/transferase [unclassified Nocardioides]
MGRRSWGAAASCGVLLLVALVLGGLPTRGPAAVRDDATISQQRVDDRPDIVLILMDDFSMELLSTMPEAQRMVREGAAYRNSYVVDSLCCPSRAALLTGQAPHQTGVRTNTRNGTPAVGGYPAFAAHDNPRKQFSVALQGSGYTTGFIGKFLNVYDVRRVNGKIVPPPKVPGWDDWQAILSGGYNGWGFRSTYLDEDGTMRLRTHAKPPRNASHEERDRGYATNVTADMAVRFLRDHRDDTSPYFLEIATYGSHAQIRKAYPGSPAFPSAFRDRAPRGDLDGGNCGLKRCGSLSLRDLLGYDDPRDDNAPTYLRPGGRTAPAPAWRTNPIILSDKSALRHYRDRVQMVQSIDRLIARVRREVGPDTYVVLTADNGIHLGQHQLNGGKGTPYDSDVRVPLAVVGPDVVPGRRSQFVSNIDLASTFEELAGLESPAFRSGTSFAASLRAPQARGGRYVFFEHTWSRARPGEFDPDKESGGSTDVVPSYIAVRSARGLLVRVDLDKDWRGTDYAWELYRYDVPWEDRNVFAEDHAKPWVRDLKRRIERFDGCRPAVCRALSR